MRQKELGLDNTRPELGQDDDKGQRMYCFRVDIAMPLARLCNVL